jgi:hypothetical protein
MSSIYLLECLLFSGREGELEVGLNSEVREIDSEESWLGVDDL